MGLVLERGGGLVGVWVPVGVGVSRGRHTHKGRCDDGKGVGGVSMVAVGGVVLNRGVWCGEQRRCLRTARGVRG